MSPRAERNCLVAANLDKIYKQQVNFDRVLLEATIVKSKNEYDFSLLVPYFTL